MKKCTLFVLVFLLTGCYTPVSQTVHYTEDRGQWARDRSVAFNLMQENRARIEEALSIDIDMSQVMAVAAGAAAIAGAASLDLSAMPSDVQLNFLTALTADIASESGGKNMQALAQAYAQNSRQTGQYNPLGAVTPSSIDNVLGIKTNDAEMNRAIAQRSSSYNQGKSPYEKVRGAFDDPAWKQSPSGQVAQKLEQQRIEYTQANIARPGVSGNTYNQPPAYSGNPSEMNPANKSPLTLWQTFSEPPETQPPSGPPPELEPSKVRADYQYYECEVTLKKSLDDCLYVLKKQLDSEQKACGRSESFDLDATKVLLEEWERGGRKGPRPNVVLTEGVPKDIWMKCQSDAYQKFLRESDECEEMARKTLVAKGMCSSGILDKEHKPQSGISY